MKSILCGIVAIAIMTVIAWAIAPWMILLWFTRNYQIEIKPKSSDFPFETVEVGTEEVKEDRSEPESEDSKELEDLWEREDAEDWNEPEPVVSTPEPSEILEIVEEEEEPVKASPFPVCPDNLTKMTLRELQLLCGEINKVKRGSIGGYRNKKDKDKNEVIEKIEMFYQTI